MSVKQVFEIVNLNYTLKACIDRNSACVKGTHFSFLNYENAFESPDEVGGDSTFKRITV